MEIEMETTPEGPLVIARGGASAEAPEHTIAAFEAALAEGADALAVRVRLSRDGHPVAFGPAVLERFRDRARIWVELPDGADAHAGIEERVVATLEIYDVVERCLVHSADRSALGRVRAFNPAVPLGTLWSAGPLASALPSPGEAEAVCSAVELLGAGDVERIRAARLGCYVYTVNEPVLADRLIDWRVDGIFTDRPGLVRARIGRR